MSMSIKKLFATKKVATVTAAVALTLGASGAAFAYFTSTGSGSGSGAVGTSTTWGVTGGSETGQLYPLAYPAGAQALTGGKVTNNGSGNQYLNQIVATIVAPTMTPAGLLLTPACTATDFQFVSSTWTLSNVNGTATINPSSVDLAPSGVYDMTGLSVAMVDDGANQNACQGATVNITYAAS
jgi:hypothetical protein